MVITSMIVKNNCARGLEYKVPENCKERQRVKSDHLLSVLREQELLGKNKESDQLILAQIAMRFSKRSVEEALIRGLIDDHRRILAET